MLREFSEGIPMALANGRPNPHYIRAISRGLTKAEDITTDLVAHSIGRGLENLEDHLLEEALFEFETAAALLPNFPYAHWNRAQVLLMMGRYAEAFPLFDWRFKLFGDDLWHSGLPLWNGESLEGKRLLLWHEHGYGDSIQFLRWVPELKRRGARISLALVKPLRRLGKQLDVEVLEDPDMLNGRRNWDYRLPIFNIPAAMAATQESIPPAPYFFAKGHVQLDHPSIGIAWSGNPRNSREKHRTVGLDRFLELTDLNGHTPYAMQTEDVAAAPERGIIVPCYQDFAHTLEWLAAMDHIVTVDTAVAHLAGAMGHPSLHVVVPRTAYWPWYQSQAWYRTANVYRQKRPGEWDEVFARVNAALWGEPWPEK